MRAIRAIIARLRRPAAYADRETAGQAQRLRDDRETIRGSQGMTGMFGAGQSTVTPTPDVLHPDRDR
jgi:hypothetical protein